MCKIPGCRRERFARDGDILEFCGRMHAYEYSRIYIIPPPTPQRLAKCKLPGCNRCQFFEADIGRAHDFCSKMHANEAIARGLHPAPNQTVQVEPDKALRCSLYGCSARRYSDPETGRMHDFCGWKHAFKALEVGQQAPPVADLSAPREAFIRTSGAAPVRRSTPSR
jgi:hypothetical protein